MQTKDYFPPIKKNFGYFTNIPISVFSYVIDMKEKLQLMWLWNCLEKLSIQIIQIADSFADVT